MKTMKTNNVQKALHAAFKREYATWKKIGFVDREPRAWYASGFYDGALWMIENPPFRKERKT